MLLIVTCFVILSFFPGHMSGDSFHMFSQALRGEYTDWHSPILAFTWRLLMISFKSFGPAPVLFLQVFFAAVSLMYFLWVICSDRFRLLLVPVGAALLLIYPPILGWLGVVSKDIAFGVPLILASAILVKRWRSPESGSSSILSEILLWSCFIWSIAVRYNGLPAVIFLIWFRFYQYFDGPAKIKGEKNRKGEDFEKIKILSFCSSGTSRPIIGHFWAGFMSMLIGLFLLVGARFYIKTIMNPIEEFPSQQVMLFDLAGLSTEIGRSLLPEESFPGADIATLSSLYWPESVNPLFWGEGKRVVLNRSPDVVRMIKRRWAYAILDYPIKYLTVRWRMFRGFLGASTLGKAVCAPFHDRIDENNLGITVVFENFNKVLISYLNYWKDSLLNRLWLYLSVLFISTAFLLFTEAEAGTWLVPCSGLVYTLSYFFFAPACDLRYGWYSVAIAMLSIPLCFSAFLAKSQSLNGEKIARSV